MSEDDVRPVPPVSRVLETALYVGDLQVSLAFYQRVFGFETLLEDQRMCALQVPGGAVLLLFLRGGSTTPSPMPGGIIPPHDGSGILHVCFAIPLASLRTWDDHLAAQGVAIESRVIQSFGGTSLYFRDPDGHSVEVATPGLWRHY